MAGETPPAGDSGTGNVGLYQLIQEGLSGLKDQATSLQTELQAAKNPTDDSDQTAVMLELQYKIGQYNTLIELTSNITKSLTDAIKSISQKV